MELKHAPVDVISVCNANGDIRPLRLRFEDDQRQLMRVNIEEVVSTKEIKYVGAEAQIFLCRAWVAGVEWLFELKYTIRSHSWCLMRRLH